MNSRSLAETGNQAESPGQARTKGSTKKATVKGQSGALEGLLLSWHVCQRGAMGGCPGSRFNSTRQISARLGLTAVLQGWDSAKS